MLKKYFGPKEYYMNVLKIGLPLALSNLLNSCASIVDGVMVSSIGESMVTAVGNARNIIMLNDMVGWGIISGITIFGAQFYGAKQKENMARTFGLCITLMMLNTLLWIIVTYTAGERVLTWYLNDAYVVENSLIYLKIYVIALIPGAFAFSLATLFKCEGSAKLTFYVSGVFCLLNCILNYIFINVFHMGIAGAAYGTLVTMIGDALTYYVLMIIRKPYFYEDLKTTFHFDMKFIKPVLLTMIPVLLNEGLFGIGQTLFNKAFGLLGTKQMDAYYVANEMWEIFTFIIWGFGAAISIVIGTTLGEGKIDEAIKEADYQLGLAFLIGTALALCMVFIAPLMIPLYHVKDPQVYQWTKGIIYVFAFKIFLRTFTYTMFSTLKAGGDSKVLNIYDSGLVYAVGIPLAFLSVKLNLGSIVVTLLIVQLEQVIRCILTLRRYKSGVWAKDLTKLVV